MRPLASDYDPSGDDVLLDSLGVLPYPSVGTFVSAVHDAGDDHAVWSDLTAGVTGSGVSFETRSGDTPAPDSTWSPWQPLSGNAIKSPAGRRYVQYRATLTTADPLVSPTIDSVAIGYEIDSTVPVAPSIDVQVTGTSATVSFSSPDTDLEGFECSLDGSAFATCTPPDALSGLAPGAHTLGGAASSGGGSTARRIRSRFLPAPTT